MHVLLLEVADDALQVPSDDRHAGRRLLQRGPVVLGRQGHVRAAAEVEHQRRHHPVQVAACHAQRHATVVLPRRRHEASVQLPGKLPHQRLVRVLDQRREGAAGVDDDAALPEPLLDFLEIERRARDGQLGLAHGDPHQREVVERAVGVVLGALHERHGHHGPAAAAQARRGADEQVARRAVVVEVGREAVGEPLGARLGCQRQAPAAEPYEARRAVEHVRRREPREAHAPEGERGTAGLEGEGVGAEEPDDAAGAVGDPERAGAVQGAEVQVVARARLVLARHGREAAGAGRVEVGQVLPHADLAEARGALRPDEAAAGVDEGLRALRRVADHVLRDVLPGRPVHRRTHAAAFGTRGGQVNLAAEGDGTAHALRCGVVPLGVDMGELHADPCVAGAATAAAAAAG